jgi:sulfate adenylyltransferase
MNNSTQEALATLPRLTLTPRQLFDLEQILVGGFAPLTGFLNKEEYESVVTHMRLVDGALWPIPIVLDVARTHDYAVGNRIILCDSFGNTIAFMTIESIYMPNKREEVQKVYGTDNLNHPGVRYVLEEAGDVYLGGPVELIARSPMHDFKELRRTPKELKQLMKEKGWKNVVAFQTRNPVHRAHFKLIMDAADAAHANVLLHPVVGLTKEGDIDYISRVRAYKRLVEKRLGDRGILSLLPIACAY